MKFINDFLQIHIHAFLFEWLCQQVIRNLISNALKFTPEDGVVTVHCSHTEDENNKKVIRISVTDTGAGISAVSMHYNDQEQYLI